MSKFMISHLYYSNELVCSHRCVCKYYIISYQGYLNELFCCQRCVYLVFWIETQSSAAAICLKIYVFMHAMKNCSEGMKKVCCTEVNLI